MGGRSVSIWHPRELRTERLSDLAAWKWQNQDPNSGRLASETPRSADDALHTFPQHLTWRCCNSQGQWAVLCRKYLGESLAFGRYSVTACVSCFSPGYFITEDVAWLKSHHYSILGRGEVEEGGIFRESSSGDCFYLWFWATCLETRFWKTKHLWQNSDCGNLP